MFDLLPLTLPHEQLAVLPVLQPGADPSVTGSTLPNPPQPPK